MDEQEARSIAQQETSDVVRILRMETRYEVDQLERALDKLRDQLDDLRSRFDRGR